MPRLRRLSSREIVRIPGDFGFEVTSMRGSHAKLVRVSQSGHRQILIVPMHNSLPLGTISAIYRQASQFLPTDELRTAFFTD